MEKQGHRIECRKPIPIQQDGHIFNEGFRADLMLDGEVIVVLKFTKGSA
jgi:hypothetical protein